LSALRQRTLQEKKEEKMIGTVDKWNDEKGYGFIKASGYRDSFFVHRTAIQVGPSKTDSRGSKRFYLAEGDQVEFESAPARVQGKGPQAVNVRVV
jgi:cold shock CspA family protein